MKVCEFFIIPGKPLGRLEVCSLRAVRFHYKIDVCSQFYVFRTLETFMFLENVHKLTVDKLADKCRNEVRSLEI